MKKANIIFSAICGLIAIAVIAIASGYPTAENYGTGVPGPGLWPIAISILMLIYVAILLIKTIKNKADKETKIDLWNNNTKRVYLVMLILLIYIISLQFLGFIISTAILEFGLIQWFAKKKPYITAIISIGITLIIYGIFQYILNVPVGSFGIFSM